MPAFQNLMVVDVPNMNALFWRTQRYRPNWSALLHWAIEHSNGTYLRANAYLNYPIDNDSEEAEQRRKQELSLRRSGFRIIAARKEVSDDDIDQDMLVDLTGARLDGELKQVFIVSHDMRNFANAITQLEVAGIECIVVAFQHQVGARNAFIAGVEHRLVDPHEVPHFCIPIALPSSQDEVSPSA